jgi:hypothetical protein
MSSLTAEAEAEFGEAEAATAEANHALRRLAAGVAENGDMGLLRLLHSYLHAVEASQLAVARIML